MSSKVLVTGGAGYVGSHACKAVAAAGYTPITYDNLVTGHRQAVRWGPLEIGDILDRIRLDEVLKRHRPDAILHFAASIQVGESVRDPGKYYRNNVVGSLTLLEAVRDHGVPVFVLSSTAAVYGDVSAVPVTESHPKRPANPYGESKRLVEVMLHDFAASHGTRYAALRYFNAAGSDPDGEIGEAHRPTTHLIPRLLEVAGGTRSEALIHGDDYPTPDGTCIRDYVHVTDLGEAHVLVLDRLLGGGASGAWNLGTGNGWSVSGILTAARAVTGHPIPTRVGPRRPGDAPQLVADPSLAMAELGWSPRYTTAEQIIEHDWRWVNSEARRSW
jgi:UDP-arabinose 4-epimerase